ncbi:hypothetical protein PG984_003542 [Apiospora sp. TS-2023a]
MMFRLACFSILLCFATAAPANDAQAADNNRLPSCSERFTTAPDLLVRDIAYRATQSPPPFQGPWGDDFTVTLSFRVTNTANATDWSCEVGAGARFPHAPDRPTSPDQNVMNPEAVNDNCYSREDPDPNPGFFPPDGRPRRATWFSFDKEGGTSWSWDKVSTYEIRGEKELPLECVFEDYPPGRIYICDHVDTTMATHFI